MTPSRAAAVLLLLSSAAHAAVPAPVQAAVDSAVAIAGARAEVLDVQGELPAGCALTRAEVPRPVQASSRVAVHLFGAAAEGRRCEGWAWAHVRLAAPALVTTRAVAAGEPIAAAVMREQREVLPGRAPVAELPEGAVADRPLAPGAAVDASALRVGPRAGEIVTVVARAGALTVESTARAVPCRRGRVCAVLPSGRRVEGAWHGGRIDLESP